VLFTDGSFIEKEYLESEIEELDLMIEGTPKDLLRRVEVEDKKETLIYSYKRKTDYVY
jgi:hypothetical protein